MKTCKHSLRKVVPVISIAVALLFCVNSTFATIYYVSTTGNDATGNGSVSKPWKTLYKATSAVSTVGDIIHVNAGTYIETAQCLLKPGVSLEGEGAVPSIIKSTLSAQFVEILNVRSAAEGSNGNQYISNLTFDGQNRTTSWAIAVFARSNVSIHHCSFINFDESAVLFIGRTDFNVELAPTTYSTGNSFYNNTVTNCSKADASYGRAAVWCAGQQGTLIYNNTLTQNSRGAGLDGYLIKLINFTKGVKIYNNTITKSPYPYSAPGTNNYWDFAIEIGDVSGCEIYNNTIQGCIDANRLTKGSYTYSMYIHNNIIGQQSLPSNTEHGIIFEYDVETAIIDSNTFKYLTVAVEFSTRSNSAVNNIRISRNLMHHIGKTGGTFDAVITFISDGSNNYTCRNFSIWNNTIISDPTGANYFGLSFSNAASVKNLHIENNIGQNMGNVIVANNASVIDSFYNRNNNWYNNGNGNNPLWVSGAPANAVTVSNTSVNPNLDANYKPIVGSPLIDAGLFNGLSYVGAAPDKGFAEYQSALPVKLIEFNVSKNGGSNDLQWKTAIEINSAYFIVQRSANGKDFESIGSVQAVGFSNSIQSYTFTDFTPMSYSNYYRIISVDKDKSEEYSNIVFVQTGADDKLDIIAAQLSSGKNSLAVTIAAKQSQKVLLNVFDNNGKSIFTEPVMLQKGMNFFDKNIQKVSQGIYYVKVQTGTEAAVKNILSTN